MFAALKNKEKKIAIVGLGYVGLPLAMGFADKLSVIGYDINEDRLAKLREGIDPNGELESSQWKGIYIFCGQTERSFVLCHRCPDTD